MFMYWKFGPSVVVVLDGQGLVGALKVTEVMPSERIKDIFLGPSVFSLQHGGGEMAQWLNMLPALQEDPGLVLSTHIQVAHQV